MPSSTTTALLILSTAKQIRIHSLVFHFLCHLLCTLLLASLQMQNDDDDDGKKKEKKRISSQHIPGLFFILFRLEKQQKYDENTWKTYELKHLGIVRVSFVICECFVSANAHSQSDLDEENVRQRALFEKTMSTEAKYSAIAQKELAKHFALHNQANLRQNRNVRNIFVEIFCWVLC